MARMNKSIITADGVAVDGEQVALMEIRIPVTVM